jgi:hypothetical protein
MWRRHEWTVVLLLLIMGTAPRGQWVWWTLVQHLVAGPRYEFLYMHAVTGTATSHCAE